MSHLVHLGDCLDPVTGLASLPDKSVDHVLTDPPYEAECHGKALRSLPGANKWRSAREGHIGEYQIDFPQITEEQRSGMAREATRLSRGWVAVFCQIEGVVPWRAALEAAGAKWRRAAIWVKPDSAPKFNGDGPAQGYECIALAWAGGGRSVWNGGGKRGVYEACVNDFGRLERPHPTSKPIELMEQLISDFTDPGELVCDPFAGSGTTGVACKRLGRRFVGWERDPKYHSIAVKRIDGAREQLGLFRGVREPEPKQGALLDVPRARRGEG